MLFRTSIIAVALSLSACSTWVYRIDIPQGNYLEQKSIDKIQVDMTKEQVKFILGSPVMVDAFDKDTWNYVYRFKSGRSEKLNMQKIFTIKFVDDKLVSAEGDFELSENFNTSFNAPITSVTPNENKEATEHKGH
ncbi:MAG: outer membrane protein assembly factor BamE [Colwellia sp.]|nr:outer membrane protein assembly factor BamE [Colwellia sp.]